MQLDAVTVIRIDHTGKWIEVERIDALHFRRDRINDIDLTVTAPLQFFTAAHHWRLDDGCREVDQITDDVIQRLIPTALDQLILDQIGHARSGLVSFALDLSEQRLFVLALNHLNHLRRDLHAGRLNELNGVLLDSLLNVLLHFLGQIRYRRRIQ